MERKKKITERVTRQIDRDIKISHIKDEEVNWYEIDRLTQEYVKRINGILK